MSPMLAALVLLPLVGSVLAALLPGRAAPVAVPTSVGTSALAAVVTVDVATTGSLALVMAGWSPPLGITLRGDGLAAAMVAMTAVVGLVVTGAALLSPPLVGRESFWPLWLALWSGLNAAYLAGDLFTAYVALELVGLSAVGLVGLGGRTSWAPALRYLFVAVLGSLAYLLGVALVVAQTGTLDMAQAAQTLEPGPTTMAALAVMAVGLSMKTALLPLHAWLPPAHAGAPGAVSPLLSALVVKASFVVLLRVWYLTVGEPAVPMATLLGVLGVTAVLWGGALALRQERLKRVVAYSTVAQVGYFFLVLPLAAPGPDPTGVALAGWTGALVLVLAHGLAKAAMFLAAGILVVVYGSDRLADLGGAADRMPMTVLALALSAVTLAGLPPSLGFVGKWQLLQSAIGGDQWWWAPVLLVGGLLTAAYAARAVRATLGEPASDAPAGRAVTRPVQAAPLGLAVLALLLGFAGEPIVALLEVDAPVGAG
jgi:multicomponent Na+:H+ antiporter subunit D